MSNTNILLATAFSCFAGDIKIGFPRHRKYCCDCPFFLVLTKCSFDELLNSNTNSSDLWWNTSNPLLAWLFFSLDLYESIVAWYLANFAVYRLRYHHFDHLWVWPNTGYLAESVKYRSSEGTMKLNRYTVSVRSLGIWCPSVCNCYVSERERMNEKY